ncbi:MAG: phosphotransferase [Actinomycetes bacterium]
MMDDATVCDDVRVLAGPPTTATPVPDAVQAVAAGRPVQLVWRNELDGLTCAIGTGSDRIFVKWVPTGCGIDLDQEAVRLAWAAPLTPVPRVVDEGRDAAGSWIVTAALPGENAVSDRWQADPATAVAAIGRGLQALHEGLPVESCPFSWSAEDRLADAHRRASAGALEPQAWHPIHRSLGVDRALRILVDQPPVDQLFVCHGDACAPNTLLTEDGHWSGHVDLGALGVADRWADLAIATWSTEWNYGPGWETQLLDAYGVDPDPDRTRYYRLLWDLGP